MDQGEERCSEFVDSHVGALVSEPLKILVPRVQPLCRKAPLHKISDLLQRPRAPRRGLVATGLARGGVSAKGLLEDAVNKLSEPHLDRPRGREAAETGIAVLQAATEEAQQVGREAVRRQFVDRWAS